ncbi:NADH:flavin oxidoreductase [Dasania sp. GY-MA-18]|uniref:NADH:flavin oxidoreductase n=1 Tax=Dasania phycosphaerae TaxID=2950436 RepID=A0A9J6RN71_9GAMM|nr:MULTISPECIES: NADH:flavin oxidoreductase [Dasania]MCR8923740.1 NADH:flavin oxidoreductase [Dasania sp. GY-MA-18]MCZ0866174.1 NADH:flavin oxidoreductase [Dasania phycosphaerae]MCZ0869898.1 NADH:flavin oxidoreductase [Dasania phycosphaerae]
MPKTVLDSLFTPVAFGKTELPNRIVMSPMSREHCLGGVPDSKVAEYYRRRVLGGVSLIITEGTFIEHEGASAYPDNMPRFYGNDALAGWAKVLDAVHQAGGKIIPQLWHVGAVRRPGAAGPNPKAPGYGPMEIRDKDGQLKVKAMTQADIDDVIAAYVKAAQQAESMSFDGIEIHAAHGYLIDQFFWQQMNQRQDQYGGSLSNRIRFACEIVSAIRAAVSRDFPIVFRFSQWKQQDYNATIADTPEELSLITGELAKAGVDIFHVSTRRYWQAAFANSPLTLSAWVKKLSGKPVIAVGSVGLDTEFGWELWSQPQERHLSKVANISQLNTALSQGDFDFIAVGRALIADPEWAHKIRDQRLDEIVTFERKCLDSLV